MAENKQCNIEPIVLAVVGGRDFNDYDKLRAYLDQYCAKNNVTKIISGGAIGADSLAKQYAREKKILFEEFKPDWVKYKKAAGIIRNKIIVKEATRMVACWDGKSPGTKHSLEHFRRTKRRIPTVLKYGGHWNLIK